MAPLAATSRPMPALTFSVILLSALIETLVAPTLVTTPASSTLTPPSTVRPYETATCLTKTVLVASTPHPDP